MTIRNEHRAEILGVPGRFDSARAWPHAPELFSTQTWRSNYRHVTECGEPAKMRVEIRFDDNCKNGRHSFAITGYILHADGRPRPDQTITCGAIHDEIAEHFPELAPLIRWHLCATDGPMHYIANAVYLAGDKDHYGRSAGDVAAFERGVRFAGNPITHKLPRKFIEWLEKVGPECVPSPYDFEVIAIEHRDRGQPSKHKFSPKFTFGGYAAEWHQCPFETEREALEMIEALQRCGPEFVTIPTAWSEGKPRNLDAARRVAVWPDATDQELMQEPEALKAALAARLPALLAEFERDVRAAGFLWTPAEG